jgi:hypothetical protein
LAELQVLGVIVRDLVETGFLHRRPAIDDRTRRTAEGDANPIVGLVALAVLLAEKAPAAVALAENSATSESSSNLSA